MIGINFFQQQWSVLRCTNGTIEYLDQDWAEFIPFKDYQVVYHQSETEAVVRLDRELLWSGEIAAPFTMPTSLGVALYGLEDSGPLLYDDLKVTDP